MTETARATDVRLVDGPGQVDLLEGGREHLWRRLGPALRVALLVSVLLVGLTATGIWVVSERRAGPDRAVVEALERYTRAWNEHDPVAVRASLAERGTLAAGEHLRRALVGPMDGVELAGLVRRLARADVALETTSPPVVTGTGPYRVAVAQQFSYVVQGVSVHEEGVSLFTLVRADGRLRIAEHTWWRPFGTTSPSMLWAA